MIITRTPFRISFFGGGTDYPDYYTKNGGAVLATTIDKYCYISLRYLPPFFDHKYRIVWSLSENVNEISQIQHPSVRECLRFMEISRGVEVHHDGDLPARSGLGSSSSFTVGLLHALFALKGKLVSKLDLSEAAIHVEQNMIRENVGSQDQSSTSYGGLNIIRFNGDPLKHIEVQPLCLPRDRLDQLQNHLMLFYTGISRHASEIASEQIQAIPSKGQELRTMASMVDEASGILCNGSDISDFGRLMHESWGLKRSLTKLISNQMLDDIYDKARNAGAVGGKLLGAGGGGFFLFFVRPENQAHVKQALKLLHVPIRFDFTGSQLIHYTPPIEY